MTSISLNLEQLVRYIACALHTRTTKGMCMQNIIGISVTVRALEPGVRTMIRAHILDPPPPPPVVAAVASMQ